MAGAIWLSYGKVLLSIGLVVFTLGDMAGGNPMHTIGLAFASIRKIALAPGC
jgi:hypothetical protein